MSYGFRSISSSGFVQIDDSFSNFTLLQSGVAVGSFLNISYPSVPTQVFGFVKIPLGSAFYITSGAGSTPYEYRIYARNEDIPASISYGMRVRSASNAVVFDSGTQKVRVASASYGLFSGTSGSITIPSPGFHPFFAVAGASGITGGAFIPPGLTAIFGVTATQNGNFSVTFQIQQVGVIGLLPEQISLPQPVNKPLILGQ